jgi:LPS sulfotransferase NodH
MLAGLSGISSARYDLKGQGPFRRAYIIAASYRCGSTHLCTRLWKTGLLGAPFEYLNYEHEMKYLYSRLGADSPEDYLDRLIARRMSDNGVFGLKSHFHHFRAALRACPSALRRLQPLQFIFIRRDDKIAQAVSLAKALQTRAWLGLTSLERHDVPLFYCGKFICACLEEIRRQEASWLDWFETQKCTPHVVLYEDLLRDERQTVAKLCTLLGVANDKPSTGEVPVVNRQSDSLNAEWISRFKAELSAQQ